MSAVDADICHRMASLRKLYSMITAYLSKVKYSIRDLPALANAHTSVTSATTASDRHLPTVANKCDECKYCRTQSSSPARRKLTHRSRRPFKCDECDEGDTLHFAVDQCFRCLFLYKVQMVTKPFWQFCLHFYGHPPSKCSCFPLVYFPPRSATSR